MYPSSSSGLADIWTFAVEDGDQISAEVFPVIARGRSSYTFPNMKSIVNGKTNPCVRERIHNITSIDSQLEFLHANCWLQYTVVLVAENMDRK